MELVDSIRPASWATYEIKRLASELDIDLADVAPRRVATAHTDRSADVAVIQQLAGVPPLSERLSDSQRIVVDEDTCRHEAGHAVVAHGLGWHVVSVDAIHGETKIEPPDYQEQTFTARFRQHDAIAAAGSVAAGTSSLREANLCDRVAVRGKGGDFKDARKLAEKLLADRWAKPALERLTRALIMVGRLEGDALLQVLEG